MASLCSEDTLKKSDRQARKSAELRRILLKQETRARFRQIRNILKKTEAERTVEENVILEQSPESVEAFHARAKIQRKIQNRLLEIEDPPEKLEEKCKQLAEAIGESKKIVVYTGAGISTAASIPDYRGPNGVWTLLQKGQQLQSQDLTDAEPTLTHMCIVKLYKEGYVKHVVSQNCDGLHLRSGIPRSALSELHGNMYIEICYNCKPPKEYVRLFDVTERTGVRKHYTGRRCYKCGGEMCDTIVHFGEKGRMRSPYRWKEAAAVACSCDLILCLGSSLKVLKKYPCLWCMNKKPKHRPKLFIINLQWTPKDDFATLKINGKCDDVMKLVFKELEMSIPVYRREQDNLFRLVTPLNPSEYKSTTKKQLQVPESIWKKLLKRSVVFPKLPPNDKKKTRTFTQNVSDLKYKTPKSSPSHSSQGGETVGSARHERPGDIVVKNGSLTNVVDFGLHLQSFRAFHSENKDHSYCWQPRIPENRTEVSISCVSIFLDHDYLNTEQFLTLTQSLMKCERNTDDVFLSGSRDPDTNRTLNNTSPSFVAQPCSAPAALPFVSSYQVNTRRTLRSSLLQCEQWKCIKVEPDHVSQSEDPLTDSAYAEDQDDATDCSSTQGAKAKRTSTSGIPGWFGKGCNLRKKKRKL